MKIVFVDKKEAVVKVKNKTIEVNNQKIPMRLVDTVVLASSSHLMSRDIVKMTKEGITLLLLSARSDEISIVHSAQSKNASLKLSQYKAQDKALEIAQYFVSHKVKYHTEHLRKHDVVLDSFDTLEHVQSTQSIDELLGIEGSFAREYFGHYFTMFPKGLHHGKRSRNPPLDPVNAMLSFCYMMFYNLITVRLLSFGFEPSIGFLHRPFRSHNALSSDMMELFRADVNEFVWRLFDDDILDSSDFSKQTGVYLRYESRKKFWVDFKDFTQTMQVKLDSHIANLRAML